MIFLNKKELKITEKDLTKKLQKFLVMCEDLCYSVFETRFFAITITPAVFKLGSADRRGSATGSRGPRKDSQK